MTNGTKIKREELIKKLSKENVSPGLIALLTKYLPSEVEESGDDCFQWVSEK